MSLADEQPIACPACGAVSRFRIQRSVNAAVDPSLVEALLAGALFTFACASCGHRARVVHPELCYVDPARDLLVQLDAAGRFDPKTVGDLPLPATSRLVRDSNALVEKVRIARADLDDRVVEGMKLLARATLGPDAEGKRMLFEAAEGDGETARLRFTLIGADGSFSGLGLPRATYPRLAAELAARGRLGPTPPFAVVDEMTAREALLTG